MQKNRKILLQELNTLAEILGKELSDRVIENYLLIFAGRTEDAIKRAFCYAQRHYRKFPIPADLEDCFRLTESTEEYCKREGILSPQEIKEKRLAWEAERGITR